jgi:hypothetical protein
MIYPDGTKYKGTLSLESPKKLIFDAWFTGDFVNGQRHGQGAYFYVNGDVYEGQWENDQKHGQGGTSLIEFQQC